MPRQHGLTQCRQVVQEHARADRDTCQRLHDVGVLRRSRGGLCPPHPAAEHQQADAVMVPQIRHRQSGRRTHAMVEAGIRTSADLAERVEQQDDLCAAFDKNWLTCSWRVGRDTGQLMRFMRSPAVNRRISAKSVPSPTLRDAWIPNGAPVSRGVGTMWTAVARGWTKSVIRCSWRDSATHNPARSHSRKNTTPKSTKPLARQCRRLCHSTRPSSREARTAVRWADNGLSSGGKMGRISMGPTASSIEAHAVTTKSSPSSCGPGSASRLKSLTSLSAGAGDRRARTSSGMAINNRSTRSIAIARQMIQATTTASA
jgi:hypothetical protein